MGESIRGLCKNYNAIIKCEFLDDDLFSIRLVEYYKVKTANIPDNDASRIFIRNFDCVLRKYVEDYNFSKKLKNSVDIDSIIKSDFSNYDRLVEYMLKFSEKYDNDKGEIIINTKWI
jgi:hypothetical protein